MKKLLVSFGIAAVLSACGSTNTVDDLAVNNPIVSAIDLTKVVNDKVPVTINPGRFTTASVTYRLPKVIQGTYSISDFGKYIDDFKAFDYNGSELSTTKWNEYLDHYRCYQIR